jgi:3-oxocholest-4-en-26-oyl-CoA dehydrogenase alpha subunit
MHIALSEDQEAFRQEVRRYFASIMTPEIREKQQRYELDTPTYRGLIRRIGGDGWLGVSWPVEYGGQGRTEIEEFLFFDEAQRLGVPIPFLTIHTVGPTIMRYGSDEQRERLLPGILRGEILFSIGYSEPDAGTDLASLRTRAVRDGDHYVVTGQKMWTSLINHADYVWLACRTDPGAPKHKGISIIMVPTDAEGFSWTRVDTMGAGLTSATYYDQVRVPAANLVGEEHGGWKLMTAQLNQERIALASSGVIERRLADVIRWAQTAKLADGGRVIDQEWVQMHLARVRAKAEFLRLLNWKVAWSAARSEVDPAEASALKVFGSEFGIEAYRLLMEVIGQASVVKGGAPGAVGDGDLEVALRAAPVLTFGGGTNEIQRDIIAMLGLGLPRAPR